MRIPVITSFGGINPAGRSSFHHNYRRLVIDALPEDKAARTYQSLAALMGVDAANRQHILDHTLIRKIEAQYFDTNAVPCNKKMRVASTDSPIRYVTKARNLPEMVPSNWVITPLANGDVDVQISGVAEMLVPSTKVFEVSSAGQIPTGFDPGKLYASRSHPRGLEMGIYAASDMLGATGISWQEITNVVPPEQISVFASSGMAQLDDNGLGGLLSARANGKKATSKQLALGLAEMPADFINAYVLGSAGTTGGNLGACATFLYNLMQGVNDIKAGRSRVALIGAAEAAICPGGMEGYIAMGALGTDANLMALDGTDTVDNRRASRPFSDNCGFTIGEAANFVMLMDDELALEMGATIHGAVTDVFVNADGHKKSISSPGVGNYLTVARATAAARAIVGEKAMRHRSFVQAHGTSTPQNRTTESHILNEVAKAFGIEKWPVAAIKAYIGHTVASASADQLISSLGVWSEGIIPGIKTITHIADDVHQSNLALQAEHHEVGVDGMDVAILNAKGFGGNNASAPVLSPAITRQMLEKRHGKSAMQSYASRNEQVQEKASQYDERCLSGVNEVVYHFDHGVLGGDDVTVTADNVSLKGFAKSTALTAESPFADCLPSQE